MSKGWTITLGPWEGYAPSFWQDALSTFGNRGHATAMQNADLLNPNVLTQGPALSNLTNGTQAGVVSTLIRGIERLTGDGSVAYAVGGAKFYKFTSTTVTSDANFPHTIDKGAVTAEDGEDTIEYKGNIFYSYNHSGTAGDVGRLNGASTFDDDYMSTVPTGAAALVGAVPHQMIVGGDDVLYIANGRYMATLETTTFTAQKLDLPQGTVVVSHAWEHNRLYIAANRPYTTSAVQALGSIFLWDGIASSWEYEIRVPGSIGALWAKNGVIYVWYQDSTFTGGYKLGVIEGTSIRDLVFFTGSLPAYYQITEKANHILWVSSGQIWAWGSPAPSLPTRLFQYADGGYSSVGGIGNTFGSVLVASSDGSSNHRLAALSGYDTACSWKSLLFDLATERAGAYLDRIVVLTEPLGSGAALDATLTYDYGNASKALAQVAYGGNSSVKHTILRDDIFVQNFRLDLSFAAGSASNPVKIRKIICSGYFTDDN